MTNEQLVARIQAGEDVGENMAQLYEQVKDFIRSIAWRYRHTGEMEDLEQEGYLALYPAIDGYDPAAGCKFLTYAEKWIKWRMQRYLQMNGSCLRLPVHCQEMVQKYRRFCSEYERETGERPSDRTAAHFLGLTVQQVENIKVNACLANLGSLDAPVAGLDGSEYITVGELVAASGSLEEDAVDRLDDERLRSVLWELVDGLEGQQPAVIRRCYQNGNTLAEIGRQIGTTPEAVRQIHAKALRCLRNPARSKRLRPFLLEAERIYSSALWGNGVGSFNRTWTSSTERVALEL